MKGREKEREEELVAKSDPPLELPPTKSRLATTILFHSTRVLLRLSDPYWFDPFGDGDGGGGEAVFLPLLGQGHQGRRRPSPCPQEAVSPRFVQPIPPHQPAWLRLESGTSLISFFSFFF